MIRQLMREQFLIHRTYLIWTTALLTLAVAMASYATFAATQAAAVSRHVATAYGMDGAWRGNAQLDSDVYGDPEIAVVTRAELADIVEQANAEGAGATAMADTGPVAISHLPQMARVDASREVLEEPLASTATLTGDANWGTLLASGSAPGSGEVAVSNAWAETYDVAIGDTVWPYVGIWDGYELGHEADLGTLTVSGLLRDPLPGNYNTWAYDALIEWGTVNVLVDGAREQNTDLYAYADIAADAETPALAAVTANPWWMSFDTAAPAVATILAIGAAVVVFGLIGMAFAVGRAQAQARTGWVATARVLGARRSTVAAATLLEVLGVGLIAGVAGAVLGFGALNAEWAYLDSRQPESLVPDGVWAPWWAWLSMIGLGLIVAAVVGGVPAFWAARVAPAAALKPVTPATQAEVSRKAPIWPVVALWLMFTVPMLVSLHVTDTRLPFMDVLTFAAPLLGLGALITSVPLVIELTRSVIGAVGRRLARGVQPWAIGAGSALVGRPRQASGPAVVLALASTVAFGITTWTSLARWADQSPGMYWGAEATPGPLEQVLIGTGYDDFGAILLSVIAVGMATLVAVALAAFVSLRQATTAESDATAALGLDARNARIASGAQFGLPLASGVLLGAALGVLCAVATFSYYYWEPITPSTDGFAYSDSTHVGPAWALTHLGHATIPTLLVLAISLACVAAGTGIVAATTRTSSRPLAHTRA